MCVRESRTRGCQRSASKHTQSWTTAAYASFFLSFFLFHTHTHIPTHTDTDTPHTKYIQSAYSCESSHTKDCFKVISEPEVFLSVGGIIVPFIQQSLVGFCSGLRLQYILGHLFSSLHVLLSKVIVITNCTNVLTVLLNDLGIMLSE